MNLNTFLSLFIYYLKEQTQYGTTTEIISLFGNSIIK